MGGGIQVFEKKLSNCMVSGHDFRWLHSKFESVRVSRIQLKFTKFFSIAPLNFFSGAILTEIQ